MLLLLLMLLNIVMTICNIHKVTQKGESEAQKKGNECAALLCNNNLISFEEAECEALENTERTVGQFVSILDETLRKIKGEILFLNRARER